jgi:crossover junction endodeoxyribonuclease RuvC
MKIVGIDPGLTGAIAWISNGRAGGVVDMPVGDKTVDAAALADILRAINPDVVVIEKTQAMPKNGSIASFSLGSSTGTAVGVATTLGHPVVRLRPGDWKKASGLTGKDKEASRFLARELFPYMGHVLTRKKDADRAEALLIARAYVLMQVQERNAS